MSFIGKKAPIFKAYDQMGEERTLGDYKGKYLLLYFYPKDMTPGCTLEAELFRDKIKEFKKYKCEVVGVSTDSVKSHGAFCDKYNLPFTLLSDEDKKIVNAYKVWVEKSMYGKKYMGTERSSFLIDPKGIVVREYRKVKPALHADEVLSHLKEI